MTIINRVVIASPGGNITALVFDKTDKRNYGLINDQIQRLRPDIEQVMFVESIAETIQASMAGGELCGNATRALGYILCNGKDDTVRIKASGVEQILTVRISNKQSKISLSLEENNILARPRNNGEVLVDLGGIVHLVVFETSKRHQIYSSFSDEKKKSRYAFSIIEEENLISRKAAGVLFITANTDAMAMTPYVYVSQIDSFFLETSCASGAIATAIAITQQARNGAKEFVFSPPSGIPMTVGLDIVKGQMVSATVSGPIEILHDGPFDLEDENNQRGLKIAIA